MTDLLSKERLEQLGGSLQASAKYTAGVDAIAFSDAAKAIGELLQRREAAEKPVAWIHEDELPEGYPYDAMFSFSKVDIVRMFPIYGPTLPVVPDAMLCDFYEVSSYPDLVRELVLHVEQLQESAKRNVKPWEDTFPETLLPAYIERIKKADDACRAAMLQPGNHSEQPLDILQLSGNTEQVIDYKAIVERISEIVHGKVTDIDLLTITIKSMTERLKDDFPATLEGCRTTRNNA
ncbi:hypothetical protein F157LOC_00741 [Pectobacterium brasiliense]|uniref:hypothetical protein n=1 Tax=Pectobacterium brasiliense TaxID=180957 RepID=UPI000CE69180|nr:hypothetical protein [Pectobacterium brasiliense]PPE61907.1 hypothetical protein F157LOC_00741 [Pectobacterium brasiliense]